MVITVAQAQAIIPMAFVGRTSTDNMQDPVESLSRQLRVARSRLPEGFAITRYYWDVESGATDLDARSRTSVWQRFTQAGIPRDGGMAELRAEIKTGAAPLAGVICENIERTGRDNYDALRLERELHAAGIMIFAADEPFDAQAPEGSTILVRRVKQGIAEYFRYNLKAQMWEGLKQYVISGFNTGPCPYGYLEERTTHPNPMKANMGATRARLVPDPDRAEWVTRIFEWRVDLKLSAETIAQRLHAQGAPTRDGRPWTVGAVHSILRNPKYTGRVVIGRTRNASKSKRAGERKMRPVPREHWTWAADNAHVPLISMEVWEAAQTVGRGRGNAQDHQEQGKNGRADYPLRACIRCRQCNRRMCGHPLPGRGPGKEYYYYVCPHNPNSPRDAQEHPGHVRATVRERVMHAAVDGIIRQLLSHDRAQMLAAILPATQAEADERQAARADQLRKQITQNETAQHGLITQLERLGNDTSPAADAMRQRITDQFTDRYNQAKTLQAELDATEAAQTPAQDASLLDELPYLAEHFADAPDHLKAKLYAAFDIQVLYRAPIKQATIWATITSSTPGILAALTEEPIPGSDTAYGNLANAPMGTGCKHPCRARAIPSSRRAAVQARGGPSDRPCGQRCPRGRSPSRRRVRRVWVQRAGSSGYLTGRRRRAGRGRP